MSARSSAPLPLETVAPHARDGVLHGPVVLRGFVDVDQSLPVRAVEHEALPFLDDLPALPLGRLHDFSDFLLPVRHCRVNYTDRLGGSQASLYTGFYMDAKELRQGLKGARRTRERGERIRDEGTATAADLLGEISGTPGITMTEAAELLDVTRDGAYKMLAEADTKKPPGRSRGAE